MASQSSGRQIPNSIEDINPTATHVDRPTLNQINSVFANSQFANSQFANSQFANSQFANSQFANSQFKH